MATNTIEQEYNKYLSVPIPNKESNSAYWISWHKEMKRKYGKSTANTIFSSAWDRLKDYSGSANDSTFRDYFQSQGINIKGDNIFERGGDAVADVGDFVGNIFGTGKTIMIVVGGITFGIVALGLYNIAKNPNATAGAVAKNII